MTGMRRLRQATGLLASVFMLHLVLVGSGFACIMPAMDAMHGMAMSGSHQPMGGADIAAKPGVPESDESSAPADTACDFPWAPDGCQSMAPCAPTALTVTRSVVPTPLAMHQDVAWLAVLAPPSLRTPPELPPPRA